MNGCYMHSFPFIEYKIWIDLRTQWVVDFRVYVKNDTSTIAFVQVFFCTKVLELYVNRYMNN